ncbi:MAG TPA: acetyl-CoA carboxylase biotin carboxyl carrier protein subunit [Bryobacteraceae bacterium]|nr:acetyl-CoA carboxylase biotin carboxyl carrier protein subunit [Bryobacteraceae bacterium]
MKLKITIENKVYEVEVEATEAEASRPIPGYMIQPGAVRMAAAPLAAGAAAPKDEGNVDEDKVCRSPINGIVVKVAAQEGQQIQPGDTLLVLEAMKMETNITAPNAGKVIKIRVGPGDGVTAGQILVDFE